MKYWITDHARQRMRERGITVEQVEACFTATPRKGANDCAVFEKNGIAVAVDPWMEGIVSVFHTRNGGWNVQPPRCNSTLVIPTKASKR